MCGIGGVLGAAAGRDRAGRMVEAMRHRGPDGEGVAGLEGVAMLGACRLAVTGPGPQGAQPMWDGSGRYALVFNGEIYDHVELRRRLPERAYAGGSDTETLLHALAHRGERALDDLEGIFALAFLDADAGEVLLARDRFGVKPLYLAAHGGSLFFASEMRALLAAGVPATVRPGVLRASLVHAWVNGADTPLEAIERLPPGSAVRIRAGRRAPPRRWFGLAGVVDGAREQELREGGRGRSAEELDGALHKAVAARLPRDSPAGVLCSGGLDSSLVLAATARHGPALPAFVARFPGDRQGDETRWAARAATACGSALHPVTVDATVWREHLVACVQHFEYPMVHPNAVALSVIGRQARAGGLKVLLTGEGADELLGGYPSRHRKARLGFAHHVGVEPALEDPAPARARPGDLLTHEPWPPAETYEAAEVADLRAAYAYQEAPRADLSAVLAADLRLFLSHGLNRLDKNLMQQGIEVREPFLDRRVVSLALNLPLEHRLLPEPKAVLRDVARRYLPGELVDRPKWGFNFAVDEHMRGLRDDVLSGGLLREVLEVPAGDWRGLAGALEGKELFRAWTAEIWCRLFLAGETVDDVHDRIWR